MSIRGLIWVVLSLAGCSSAEPVPDGALLLMRGGPVEERLAVLPWQEMPWETPDQELAREVVDGFQERHKEVRTAYDWVGPLPTHPDPLRRSNALARGLDVNAIVWVWVDPKLGPCFWYYSRTQPEPRGSGTPVQQLPAAPTNLTWAARRIASRFIYTDA